MVKDIEVDENTVCVSVSPSTTYDARLSAMDFTPAL